jgi:hypothetical protein
MNMYQFPPAMPLVREIEDELGAIPALAARLKNGTWRVSELVALTHMLSAAAGRIDDYDRLGEDMIREGLDGYRRAALAFLGKVMT